MTAENPRFSAVQALSRAARDGKYINLELDAAISRSSFSSEDRALFTALVYGVCERTITLDYEIERMSGRKTSELDTETAAALRIGLYQIIFMDKIPPHAAVNETVSATPVRSRGIVNAILRRCLREGAKLHLPEDETDKAQRLSLENSIPRQIVECWMSDYPEDASALCISANRKPPITLRVNTIKTTPDDLLLRLSSSVGTAKINRMFPDMIDVSGVPVTEIYGFEEGLWFVEDAASRAAVCAAGVSAGMKVIDVCAAPGGKSFSAAIDMKNEGIVYSFDLHENKLGLIKRGAERLGIQIIAASARDGRNPDESLLSTADVVICDVPCSGLGVIAKKPDIRYKNFDEISRLPNIQGAILSASSRYVRPGGTLIYSTCTLHRSENDAVAERFISEHPDFQYSPFTAGTTASADGKLTLMPHKHGTDGFFIAKFKRG